MVCRYALRLGWNHEVYQHPTSSSKVLSELAEGSIILVGKLQRGQAALVGGAGRRKGAGLTEAGGRGLL